MKISTLDKVLLKNKSTLNFNFDFTSWAIVIISYIWFMIFVGIMAYGSQDKVVIFLFGFMFGFWVKMVMVFVVTLLQTYNSLKTNDLENSDKKI